MLGDSVIIKVCDAADDKRFRYRPPREFSNSTSDSSPSNALVELVGQAFNDVAHEYNLARHTNLGETYNPSKADYQNRKMFKQEEPLMGLKKQEEKTYYRKYHMVVPRRPGDWLVPDRKFREKFRYPAVVPMTEERLYSERLVARLPIERPDALKVDWKGRISGLNYRAPRLIEPDYGMMEERRFQRHHFAPSFGPRFRYSGQARSMISAY